MPFLSGRQKKGHLRFTLPQSGFFLLPFFLGCRLRPRSRVQPPPPLVPFPTIAARGKEEGRPMKISNLEKDPHPPSTPPPPPSSTTLWRWRRETTTADAKCYANHFLSASFLLSSPAHAATPPRKPCLKALHFRLSPRKEQRAFSSRKTFNLAQHERLRGRLTI